VQVEDKNLENRKLEVDRGAQMTAKSYDLALSPSCELRGSADFELAIL
jgi:hypothetical protein